MVPEEKKDNFDHRENKSMGLGVIKKVAVMILLIMFLSYPVAYSSSSSETTMHTNNWAVLVCTSRFWYINFSFSYSISIFF